MFHFSAERRAYLIFNTRSQNVYELLLGPTGDLPSNYCNHHVENAASAFPVQSQDSIRIKFKKTHKQKRLVNYPIYCHSIRPVSLGPSIDYFIALARLFFLSPATLKTSRGEQISRPFGPRALEKDFLPTTPLPWAAYRLRVAPAVNRGQGHGLCSPRAPPDSCSESPARP